MDLTMRSRGLVLPAVAIVACLALFALAAAPQARASEAGYEYFLDGDATDVTAATTPGLLLAGGATDNDDAMRWMIERSGGGDVVILDAWGGDDYGPYLLETLGGIDSCETFVFEKRSASYDPWVLQRIRDAEMLFIDGGNQWNYVSQWQGTPVEDAIDEAALTKPVGGISAGLAVQGQFCYAAQLGTIRSDQALANPYHSHVTLVNDFLRLPCLGGTITDSHFAARDRMGRLMTFLARIVKDGWARQARGIGVDESTSLAVDQSGKARVFGEGAVYLLRTTRAPAVCAKGQPLTLKNVAVYRVAGPSARFDLTDVGRPGRHGVQPVGAGRRPQLDAAGRRHLLIPGGGRRHEKPYVDGPGGGESASAGPVRSLPRIRPPRSEPHPRPERHRGRSGLRAGAASAVGAGGAGGAGGCSIRPWWPRVTKYAAVITAIVKGVVRIPTQPLATAPMAKKTTISARCSQKPLSTTWW